MRAETGISDVIEAQRGTLLLWMPIALAVGIFGYFQLRFEPGAGLYLGVSLVAVLALAGARIAPEALKPLALAIGLIAVGFLNAGFSANLAAAPVLRFHYYGPVTGRIIAVDRSARDMPRITLDQVRLNRVNPSSIPNKVRISLHYPRQFLPLQPGRRIMVTASLSAPSGPAEPGGFDFQRFAWFRGLGAIGYSRNPVLEMAPPDRSGVSTWLAAVRMKLAAGIQTRIPGQNGAFAAAILTGDRASISPASLETLRRSNLAHLLAISGLHMGLLTGFVFAAIRYGLALIPFLALRLPVKKIAAGAGLLTATAYLALSGANVATQRAFVMAAVLLVAVMLDRRALTLRAVALAAVIVLLLRPVSLIEAGFQMSFAATTGLVAVFAAIRDRGWFVGGTGFWRGLGRGVLMLALSSAIAGFATAPISAFHFNRVAQFGLVANLASVPAMGSVVMPSAVVAILLVPLGLDGPVWAVMGAAIGWILTVAETISALEGAVRHIVKPDGFVLGLICGGGLGLVLLRGRARFLLLLPVLAGLQQWVVAERPELLLSSNGRLLGVMGPEGRVLNRAKGNGFVAMSWLENDGDAGLQDAAAARETPEIRRVAYSWSKTPGPEFAALCTKGQVLILPRAGAVPGECVQIDKSALNRLGATTIDWPNGAPVLTGARQISGGRLWGR